MLCSYPDIHRLQCAAYLSSGNFEAYNNTAAPVIDTNKLKRLNLVTPPPLKKLKVNSPIKRQ